MKGKHLGLIKRGVHKWWVRKNNAYGNSSLNDFHLPLPKPKRYKPKRPIDSN